MSKNIGTIEGLMDGYNPQGHYWNKLKISQEMGTNRSFRRS